MQVHNDTILFEDTKLVTYQQEVCGIFNNVFLKM